MPTKLKRIESIPKDVEQTVRRTQFMLYAIERCGIASDTPSIVRLSGAQGKCYSDALILFSLAMHDCFSCLGYTDSDYNASSWLLKAKDMPVMSLLTRLKRMDQQLLLSVADDDYRLGTFKQFLRDESFWDGEGEILRPFRRAMVGWFSYRKLDSFHALHTCFSFMTRLNLPDRTDLQKVAYDDYIRMEQSLKTDGFTTWEQKIISSWFPVSSESALFEQFWPKHGPGSVADTEKAEKLLKYKAMGTDARIDYLNLRLGSGRWSPRTPIQFERCSKVVFVPKSFDKLRTICMEPSTLQWYQQGFLRSLVWYIERHPYLRRRIDLSDQSRSRELARKGSIDGSLATIDLSSASDSVTWPMVRDWTSKSSLRLIALSCRSEECLIQQDGLETVRFKTSKFAPMGSALCFPFECIVFASIVEAAIMDVGGRVRDSNYCVYGDDIIVESIYAENVVRRLEMNGFSVNHGKTFLSQGSHNFRESCGGEYLDGIDVSPVRLSRKFSGMRGLSAETPSRISGIVDLCNCCYNKLPSVRLSAIEALNKLPQRLRPLFDEDGLKGIKSDQPSNHHLQAPRYNERFQKFEIVHGILLKREASPADYDELFLTDYSLFLYRNEVDEDIRLYEYLRSAYHRESLLIPEDRLMIESLLPGKEFWVKSRSEAPTTTLVHRIYELVDLSEHLPSHKALDELMHLWWEVDHSFDTGDLKKLNDSHRKYAAIRENITKRLGAIDTIVQLISSLASRV